MNKSLPKGWVETKLGDVTTKPQYGWTTKSNNVGKYRYLRTTDIGKGSIDWHKVPFCQELPDDIEKYLLKENDILISRAGSIGLSYLVDGKIENSLFASYLIRFKPFIVPKFISYYLNSKDYWRTISDNAVGIAVQNINAPKLQAIPFPLPPLAEQERIVAKLDKLFAQHDKIKKALDRIPELLKAFRQQVLTQAVAGEKTPLKDIGVWKGGGTPSKSNKMFWKNGDILWITAKDMKGMFLNDSIDKITLEGVEGSSANLIPKNSILIVTRSGILRRILPVSTNVKETTVNQDLKALIPYNGFNYKYLLYALNGKEEEIRNLCMKSGTTVESVEFDLLKNYMLPVPPLQEQQEIVRRVESLFAKADAIEARYQALKGKIDNLPQAILHKAFKGELVPQLPTDGDAKDLLTEIMALKEETKGKRNKT